MLGLTLALGLGTAACAIQDPLGAPELSGGSPPPAAQSPTTVATTVPQPPATQATLPPAPAPAPPPPAPAPAPAVGSRNATLWPFSADSPWNTPIGSGAAYEAPSAPKTNAFRTWGVPTWMNVDRYSIPVYTASGGDPVVTLDDVTHGRTTTARIPAGAVPASGTDSNMAIIQPDGRTVDVWAASWTGPATLRVQRFEWSSTTGSGLGPQGGIRGSGLSSLGGLIRSWEVDPANPNHRDGVIRHALAVSVPTDMMLFAGGRSGYDANGYGTAKGYQWPATEQDWGSESTYRGPLPMGSLLAIPKNVDLASLGLTPAGLQIARAVQDYGAYVVDTSGQGGSVNFYAEPSLSGTPWTTQALGPNWNATDLKKIRANMVVVANNGPGSVGGGGSRPIASAPSFG